MWLQTGKFIEVLVDQIGKIFSQYLNPIMADGALGDDEHTTCFCVLFCFVFLYTYG